MVSSKISLEGKKALITGANRGIGKVITDTFLANGATVFIVVRDNTYLDELTIHYKTYLNTRLFVFFYDLADAESVPKLFKEILGLTNSIDILVNNAGIMQDALIGMIDRSQVQNQFNVNVFSVIDMIQYCTKLMRKNKSGSIINISSIVGTKGNVGQLVYSSTKGAIISMTKTAAKELAAYNIRVNAIAPGLIDTDMLRSIGENKLQKLSSNVMMNRLGSKEDVANLTLFLGSDLSSYISGQIIEVDGMTII